MSFKLFTISTMYPGYLESFRSRFDSSENMPYAAHYDLLLEDTTEFAGAYTKTFSDLGLETKCVIANSHDLQTKWKLENGNKSDKPEQVLFEQVKKFQPDVLWIENLSFTDTSWLENIRNKVKSISLIIAYHCSPMGPKILERLKYVDFVITCTPGLKEDIIRKGFRSYLVYHGFDQGILKRITHREGAIQGNFIFSGSLATGTGFHGERIELIEGLLNSGIDIDLYVNLESKNKIAAKQILYKTNQFLDKSNMTWLKKYFPVLESNKTAVKQYSEGLLAKKQLPVFGIDMYQLFHDSKVVLNYHIGVAGNFAGNMRMFEVTGVGSCLLTDNKSNMSDLFDVGSEVVVYENKEDCIAKAKWLLENEDERKKIALAGQKRTLTLHTVENRCNQIIEIINDELKKKRKNG
ncbi:MAG: glycosyltransferase [Bacteroidales bacterium]|nr:glycosyltransferase [Bacteroidales bacterium]